MTNQHTRPTHYLIYWREIPQCKTSLSRKRVARQLRLARSRGARIDVTYGELGRYYAIGEMYLNPRTEGR